MAHVDAWPGIKRHGLLSTTALLDLFGPGPHNRDLVESTRRPKSVLLEHPACGAAVIRDNKPMDDAGLLRSVSDMTPREWYRMLNSRVFFWLTEKRLETLLSARAYRSAEHCVLTLDARGLVYAYHDRIWLSPMNSGATKPIAHPRGSETFQRIKQFRFDYWRAKRRSARKAIAELAIDYSVPDIARFVTSVTIRNDKGIIRTVFQRA